MVVLELRRALLVVLILGIVLFTGQAVSAIEGCCCSPYLDNGYDYVEEDNCEAVNGIFDNTIIDYDSCRDACVDVCVATGCEDVVSDCLCGTKQIGSDEKLCCASANTEYSPSPLGIEQCELACQDYLSFSITGFVKDGAGDILQNAYVRVGDSTPVRTGSDGAYELTAKQGTIAITAEKGGCTAQTKTIQDFNADIVHNFFLECGGVEEACSQPKTCCSLNQVCVNQANEEVYSLGPLDCAVDYFCYKDGCNCEDLPPVEEDCTDGCYNVENAYCYNEQYTYYNLDDLTEYIEYCTLCPSDAQCADLPCEDNECIDGFCDPNCGPDEDPDCGNTCDFYAGVASVCTAKGFVYPKDSPQDKLTYCASCWNYEYCGFELPETCGNGQWDSNVEDCEETEDCELGFSCTDSCLCEPDDCIPYGYPIIEEKIRPFIGTTTVRLKWNLPDDVCPEDIEHFEIHRCSGGNCAYPGGYSTIGTRTGEKRDFEDTIQAQTNPYCYIVSAYYRDNPEEYPSREVCITPGHEECMSDGYDSFCVGNEIWKCETGSNEAKKVSDCTKGYCYQGPEEAVCKGTADCDSCNSVYGMFMAFSLYHIEIDYSTAFGGEKEVKCYELNDTNVCYDDYTLTSVDKFYQCSKADFSCYDYHSRDNCNSDPCGQFEDNECQWKSYKGAIGDELGLGVCVPTNLGDQNCGLCNSDDNDIFPACTRDVCSAFGNCYFDSHKDCKGRGTATCEMFTSEEDCIDSLGEYSLKNADYDSDKLGNFKLNKENNSIERWSDDYFGLGKCKWYPKEERCYRDADDNAINDLNNEDCIPDDHTDCPTDFENPTTSLFTQTGKIYGASVSIGFSVEDDIQSLDYIDTYYCFDDEDCNEGHTSNYERIDTGYWGYFIKRDFEYSDDDAANDETHTIQYYSKDSSENLEVVKAEEIHVDRKRPDFDWSYAFNSYMLADDIWRNNLNVTIDFDEPVTCSMYLDEDGSAVPGQRTLQNKKGQNFILRFYELFDSNNYKLMLDCYDDHGNPSEITKLAITIEGDKSITNVQPDHIIFDTAAAEITLSVETNNAATCRYSTESRTYAEMQSEIYEPLNHKFQGTFSAPDRKFHYKNIKFENSGVYVFYTACEITYTGSGGQYTEITEDNAGDRIFLSIDELAPETIIIKKNPRPETDMDFSKYYESVSMLFECREQKSYKVGDKTWNMREFGWDGFFGCESLNLCELVGDVSGSCVPLPQGTSTIVDLSFQEDHSETHKFMFYSKDMGGNKEETQIRILGIDNIKSDLNMTILKLDGGTSKEVSKIGYGIYNVKVDSAKKISSVVRFTVIEENSIYMISHSLNDNGLSFSGLYEVSRTNEEFYDKQGTVTFEVEVEDEHGIRSFASFNYEFDTTLPDAPLLFPIFSNEESYLDYPFRYYPGTVSLDDGTVYDDVYFINDPNLFVTGTTEELGIVKLYAAQSDIDYQSTNLVYDQTSTANMGSSGAKKEQNMPGYMSAEEGNTTIFLDNLVPLSTWEVGEYLSFSEARTAYGHYGTFYRITGINSNNVGQAVIDFSPALEKDYSGTVYLYDKEHLSDWFGLPMNFEYKHPGNNAYAFRAELENEINSIMRTDPINIFFDDEKPFITNIVPMPESGVITNRYKILEVKLVEHESGSGIRLESAEFIIIKEDGTIRQGGRTNIDYIETEDGLRKYLLTYDPVSSWENMAYTIIIELEDYAGNRLDGKDYLETCNEVDCVWELIIDNGAPSKPVLSVEGATDINPDSLERWHIDDSTPIFWLNSTIKETGAVEQLNINISRVELETSPVNAEISCEKTEKNIFRCQFDRELSEGVYEFRAYANKDLGNGEFGPEGYYNYVIIIDHTAPDVVLSLETPSGYNYIKPNDEFGVLASIQNTEYYLQAEISVGDQTLEKDPEINGNEYLFFIDEEIKWQTSDGSQDINVKIKDYAGHTTEETISIIIDNSTPEIRITNISAERIAVISENNLVIGTKELTIKGIVPVDTDKLCYNYGGEDDCLLRCSGGETENCIREDNTFTFKITMIIVGEEAQEIEKIIVLTIKDFAAHESSMTIIVTIDLLVPEEPTITIS